MLFKGENDGDTFDVNEKDALDPIWKRGDWYRLKASARMKVWTAGGPIHEPHEPLLLLTKSPWAGNDESWVLYRHKTDADADGKLVHKKWETERDLERIRALGETMMSDEETGKASVSEGTFGIAAGDVARIQQLVADWKAPLVSLDPKKSIPRSATKNIFALRSGYERSEFEWYDSPSEKWSELGRLFDSLWAEFQAIAETASRG